ncbi:MAG TPA: carboxypeptidase-like regulatory domain-containing protein [Longimicrobiales bacterium]
MSAHAAVPRRSPGGAALAALLLLFLAVPLRAQEAPAGSVTGLMLSARDGSPYRYARVTLAGSAGSGAALTDAQGAFEFREVPPGDYRVRLELLGFEPDSGVGVHVTPGSHQDLMVRQGALKAVVIPPTGAPAPVCYPGSLLERSPVLAALWAQAQRSARNRRLFDLTYEYRVHVSEKLQDFFRVRFPEELGPAAAGVRLPEQLGAAAHRKHDLRSTPARARALAARGSYAGFGVDMDSSRLVSVPEMLEVLDDGYLRSNCIQALADRPGERRVRFQPLNADPDVTDLMGNVVLDEHYVPRRIEFEYRRGGGVVARGVAQLGDGDLPGGQVVFLRHLQVEMLSAPEKVGDSIELSPRTLASGERAAVDVKYGGVRRPAPGGRP